MSDDKPDDEMAPEFRAHQSRCERCRVSSDGANLCDDGHAIRRLEGDVFVLRARLAGETAETRAVVLTATIEYMEGVKARERGGSGN